MEMIEVKVSELNGAALDWAVAVAVGEKNPQTGIGGWCCVVSNGHTLHRFCPSSEWSHGGPLLDRSTWALPYRAIGRSHLGKFEACTPGGFPHNGETPLIAACRAIVAAEFGEKAKIPAGMVRWCAIA